MQAEKFFRNSKDLFNFMKILWTGFYEGANSDRIQERSYMIIKSGLKNSAEFRRESEMEQGVRDREMRRARTNQRGKSRKRERRNGGNSSLSY